MGHVRDDWSSLFKPAEETVYNSAVMRFHANHVMILSCKQCDTYIHTYIHTYIVHVRTYTHTNMYIHTYQHVHTHVITYHHTKSGHSQPASHAVHVPCCTVPCSAKILVLCNHHKRHVSAKHTHTCNTAQWRTYQMQDWSEYEELASQVC